MTNPISPPNTDVCQGGLSCARLYVAVRADLAPGLQMAQAVHAMAEFAVTYPSLTEVWQRNSNYLIVVAVPDEQALLDLDARAAVLELRRVVVREPDLDNEVTAIALAPGDVARRLCANYPAALRVPRQEMCDA